MTKTRSMSTLAFAIALACPALAARAGMITWTNWDSIAYGDNGSASGTMGSVSVSYTGEVASPSQTASGPTNYWNPATPYLSSTVDNAPGDNGIVTLTGGHSIHQTLTFDTPVTDPIIALVSVGQDNVPVHYVFDQAFTILSSGTGYWGGASTNLFQEDPDTLLGKEGHGAIQFSGTFTSIGFDVPDYEYWHGFSVGMPSQSSPIPEPASLASTIAPAGVLLFRRRSRR